MKREKIIINKMVAERKEDGWEITSEIDGRLIGCFNGRREEIKRYMKNFQRRA